MDIFNYLEEEQQDTERLLKQVTENYSSWSREKVFDSVKVICDAILGHLKKQQLLLLDNLEKTPNNENVINQCLKEKAKVEEEVGQLVMVHVDEPGYDEYLANLLKVIDGQIKFSQRIYKTIKQNISTQNLDLINSRLEELIHHSVDYNTLQPK